MAADPSYFHQRLSEIKDLYIEVRESIVLAENFDPANEVYLSPINELRNALDHIMQCLIYPDATDKEIEKAKEHLYRAGYDAYEVLAINVSTSIVKNIEKYNAEVISTIFPKYYTDIKPTLTSIKVELAKERSTKKLNPATGTQSFTPYKEKVTKLIEQSNICTEMIPDLQTEKSKRKISLIMKGIYGLVSAIIVGIIAVWIYESCIKPHTNITNESHVNSGK